MRFFRRIAGILGFAKDEPHDDEDDTDGHHHHNHQNHHHHHNNQDHNHQNRGDKEETRRSSKGFGVKVPVAVERVNPGPILAPSNHGDGGVQGLRWYARRLRIDEDGDVADEFLDEVVQPAEVSSGADDRRQLPKKFEIKYSTRPVKVRKQVITVDGRIHQSVEHQGKLQWV